MTDLGIERGNLFDLVMQSLRRYCNFEEDSLPDSKLTFVVFSEEPFGFVFPDEQTLRQIGPRGVTRKQMQRDMASEKYKSLFQCTVDPPLTADLPSDFLAALEAIWKDIAPWCKIAHNLETLETLLNVYMPEHNVSWNTCRIGKGPHGLYSIQVWIELDTNDVKKYRKLYRTS